MFDSILKYMVVRRFVMISPYAKKYCVGLGESLQLFLARMGVLSFLSNLKICSLS